MWSDGRVDANMRSASTFPELKARLKDLIFRFLPSTCNCGAREPLTYSGKLRLHAPSGTLDGNWTCAPTRLGLWLLELLDDLVFTIGGGRNAGGEGLRVSASGRRTITLHRRSQVRR